MRDYAETVQAMRYAFEQPCYDCVLGEKCNWGDFCFFKRAADAIEELVAAVPRWISVEERLPHYLDYVLCVNKFGIQMVGYLTDYKEGGFRCESGMDSCDYITHWMPLPAPPKGDAE